MWRDLWFDDDMTQKLHAAFRTGALKIDYPTGMITLRNKEIALINNWIYFGYTHCGHDCFLWHNVMFDFFDLVPKFCRFNCYKVVVAIKNVEALLKFHNFANAIPAFTEAHSPIHGKCGIDTRWFTDKAYDAFFYCNGLEEGREKHRLICKCINNYFKDGEAEFPVILKRSCTEFERKYGPTDGKFWQNMSDEDIDLQQHLESIFKSEALPVNQPDWMKNKIFRHWLQFANTFGDKSWVNYYGGKDFLTMKAVTYHEKGGEKPKKAKVKLTKTTK